MIYLDDRKLIGWDISILHREAQHAAKQYTEPQWREVGRWFAAVADAVMIERERRRGDGPQRFPVIVQWQPDPDAPRLSSDDALERVISATTTVCNVERGQDARALRDVWHDLLVQLAELRDQRKREHHVLTVGRFIYGPSAAEPDEAA